MAKIFYIHHCVPEKVLKDSTIDSWFGSSLEKFEEFVEQYKANFTTIDKIRNLPDHFVLTFDDGYQSIIKYILPIVEKHQIPCTLFLRTDVLSGQIPYELSLADLFLSQKCMLLPNGEIIKISSQKETFVEYEKIRKKLKFKSTENRKKYIENLYNINERSTPKISPIPFLSWEEVKRLSQHPLFTIGAHTNHHPALKRHLTWSDYQEICTSKTAIETRIKKPVDQFAYPYGANNFLSRFLVRKCGYRYAFTTREADYMPNTKKTLLIPRYNIETCS